MSGLVSPDLPAWICYFVVLAVGFLVARSTVDRLLADHPHHWGFLGTWTLFLAHTLLPPLLYWFLDYTGVIHDTSLFAALVVAAGYQQIFLGGVQGILMPGQTPALWKPFESWVKRVADGIATRHKLYRDRFEEQVRYHLASDNERRQRFEQLVAVHGSPLSAAAAAQVAQLYPMPTGSGAEERLVRLWWQAFRAGQPEHYAFLLRRAKLVSPWLYWRWNGRARSQLAIWGVALSALVAGGVLAFALGSGSVAGSRLESGYYQWRFNKANASQRDRFRSREYFESELRALASGGPVDHQESAQRLERLLLPVLRELRYRDVDRTVAEEALGLLIHGRAELVNEVTFPLLIESLRTQNADVRSRIHETLLYIARADHPAQSPGGDLEAWKPKPEDGSGEIDERVQAWAQWWASARTRPGPP